MDFQTFKSQYLAAKAAGNSEQMEAHLAAFPVWVAIVEAQGEVKPPAPRTPRPEPVAPEPLPIAPAPRPSIPKLVTELKEAGQDHEFYPTTQEIIDRMVRDAVNRTGESWHYDKKRASSVLDIGAGDGRVLLALKKAGEQREGKFFHTFYAIEKSPILCGRLDPSIFVIGTDFDEQSLLSKEVDLIFSNPPYSVFENWSAKIIRQAACHTVYLVIPERWKASEPIADAIKFRGGESKVLGSFDFLEADRKARAKVELVRIAIPNEKNSAFERFFDEQFAGLIERYNAPELTETPDSDQPTQKPLGGRKRCFDNIPVNEQYPAAMVARYTEEMANVQRNYQLASQLDAALLRELEVSPSKIMECLRLRLSGMRLDYWSELFGRIRSITDRLTSKSRKDLLASLQSHTHVDFTVSNIHAVIVWAIKNANQFMDSQLIDTYENMVNKANVINYKSNQRTFRDDRWRYNSDKSENSHFALDYRIVMHSCGGIGGGYSWEQVNGLNPRAHQFLGDMLTVANNLGFTCTTQSPHLVESGDRWVSNKGRTFYYQDTKGQNRILMEVKAFQNGNLHLRLDEAFILALNVEHGRLKGWLKTPQEAAEELQDPRAAQLFHSNLQLEAGSPLLQLT